MKNILNKLSKIQSKVVSNKDNVNKFGGYGYRTKEGIIADTKPICEEFDCVLIVSDQAEIIGTWQYIKSTASLVDCETSEQISASAYAREPITQKGLQEPQMSGSASSYAGKYALGNLLAISDSSLDPDATNTHGKTSKTSRAKKVVAEDDGLI
jgi:hypothetical protein